jgi:hypothetical protein
MTNCSVEKELSFALEMSILKIKVIIYTSQSALIGGDKHNLGE